MTRRRVVCVGEAGATGSLCSALQGAGWEVHLAVDAQGAHRAILEQRPCVGVVLCSAPHEAECAELDALLCAHGEMEWIGCFGPGATADCACRDLVLALLFDHHTLPVDPARLLVSIGHAQGRALLRRQARAEEAAQGESTIVGASRVIMELLRQVRRVARATAPVLIHGESGTGKELIAQAIHRQSTRAQGPFVPINCGAIQPDLIQSELFGHVKGAFTGAIGDKRGLFESANGGAVFLDEIGDLPLALQANLLRFLQEGTIQRVGSATPRQLDVRVIAASHVDLEKAIAAGTFREDLFYRLDVLPLHVPALRERREDIRPLTLHFYRRFSAEKCAALRGFSRSAIQALETHEWPGNVRELMNRVRSAMIMAEGKLVVPADLGLATPSGLEVHNALDDARLLAERRAIHSSLQQTGRNVAGSARQLGVSRMTLYRLMAKHGINSSTP